MQPLFYRIDLTLKPHEPCLISDSAQDDALSVPNNVLIMPTGQPGRDEERQSRHIQKVFVKNVADELFRYFEEALETSLLNGFGPCLVQCFVVILRNCEFHCLLF